MEREIKFRGKRLDGGGWVYGSLVRHHGEQTDIIELEELISRKVDPVTVAQYTSCQDKVGTDIYEDDLIPVTKEGVTKYGQVMYWRSAFCVKHISGIDRSSIYALLSDVFDPDEQIAGAEVGEVAGNIHENPELLSSGGTA